MADTRFFRRQGPFPLGELARKLDGELADPSSGELMIRDLATLQDAEPGELSLFADVRHRAAFDGTRASAVLTSTAITAVRPPGGACLLFVAQPRRAQVEASRLFYPDETIEPVIEAGVSIAPDALIGPGCRIAAGAVIGSKAVLGAGCRIESNAVIGPGVLLGDRCTVGANASISHALIGAAVDIAPGVRIGTPGFGFLPGASGPIRVPQLGRVIIEDHVEIGANSTIDRGAVGDTVIGAGSVIDNLVQIAHNVRIGPCCVIAAQVGIAGSTVIGAGAVIGGQVAIKEHLKIGAGVQIAARSGVMRDIEPNTTVAGAPALPIALWRRQTVGLARMFGGTKRSGPTKPDGD